MPERYRCFKEIDYMFKDLRGRIIEKNQKIKETAHSVSYTHLGKHLFGSNDAS